MIFGIINHWEQVKVHRCDNEIADDRCRQHQVEPAQNPPLSPSYSYSVYTILERNQRSIWRQVPRYVGILSTVAFDMLQTITKAFSPVDEQDLLGTRKMKKVLRGWWTFCAMTFELVKRISSTPRQEQSHRGSNSTISTNPGLSSSGSKTDSDTASSASNQNGNPIVSYGNWVEMDDEEGDRVLRYQQE